MKMKRWWKEVYRILEKNWENKEVKRLMRDADPTTGNTSRVRRSTAGIFSGIGKYGVHGVS